MTTTTPEAERSGDPGAMIGLLGLIVAGLWVLGSLAGAVVLIAPRKSARSRFPNSAPSAPTPFFLRSWPPSPVSPHATAPARAQKHAASPTPPIG